MVGWAPRIASVRQCKSGFHCHLKRTPSRAEAIQNGYICKVCTLVMLMTIPVSARWHSVAGGGWDDLKRSLARCCHTRNARHAPPFVLELESAFNWLAKWVWRSTALIGFDACRILISTRARALHDNPNRWWSTWMLCGLCRSCQRYNWRGKLARTVCCGTRVRWYRALLQNICFVLRVRCSRFSVLSLCSSALFNGCIVDIAIYCTNHKT